MNKPAKQKHILLIGGRKKCKSLAQDLLKLGYEVTAINDNYEDCQELAKIKGLHVYNGDGTKLYTLDEVNAADCDIAIAITPKDQDNLVACQICKRNFGVKKTVSLVLDPNKIEFFHQMGVDRVVCAISTVTSIIQQQAIVDDMVNIIPVGHDNVQIAEVFIPESSAITDKKLWEIDLPSQVVVGCILRGGECIIPKGNTVIQAKDTLVIIATNGQEIEAVNILTGGAQ